MSHSYFVLLKAWSNGSAEKSFSLKEQTNQIDLFKTGRHFALLKPDDILLC